MTQLVNSVLPRTFINPIEYLTRPLFFEAGPIGGGNDWQYPGALLLTARSPGCVLVNPSWYEASHALMQSRMRGDEKHFAKTVPWERHYLEVAAWHAPRGCILFWLPEESKERPRADGKPYALDTRRELREWAADKKRRPDSRIVIGGEPGFEGLDEIQRSFSDSAGYPFVIHPTLEAAVDAAIKMAV